MERKLYFLVTAVLVFAFWLAASTVLLGQPGDPGGGGDPDNPVPISGLEFLIGGGLFLGIRSLLKDRKKR